VKGADMPLNNSPEKTVAPITPEEVSGLQRELFPPEVFESFNRFIGENIMSGCAVVKQDDVLEDLISLGMERSTIFKKGWLNVEGIYREAGWKVEYDRPGYNESYPATFTFTAKKK
jgi:hypothetical protein